jgi:hypothetical protein
MGDREKQLEQIIRDTLWMARRYADGRQTYAVGMYNDAARIAINLGVVSYADFGKEYTPWARDATPISANEESE